MEDGESSGSSSEEIAEILRSLSGQNKDDQTATALAKLAEERVLEQKQTPKSLNELADGLLRKGADPDDG